MPLFGYTRAFDRLQIAEVGRRVVAGPLAQLEAAAKQRRQLQRPLCPDSPAGAGRSLHLELPLAVQHPLEGARSWRFGLVDEDDEVRLDKKNVPPGFGQAALVGGGGVAEEIVESIFDLPPHDSADGVFGVGLLASPFTSSAF